MAIYTPGAIVGAVSGKLGGQVFVNAKKQSVVRIRPGSPRGRSAAQGDSLARFTAIQQAWADLTDAQRLTWKVAALATTTSNRLGSSSPPGAFQLFVGENSLLRLTSDDLIEEAPVGSRSAPPTDVTIDFNQGGPLTVEAEPPDPFGVALFFIYGWTQSKGYHTNKPPEFRFLFQTPDTSLSEDVQTQWEAVWGILAADQAVTVAVACQTVTSFRSDVVIVRGTTQ